MSNNKNSKMMKLLQIVTVLLVLISSIYAQEDKAKKLCDSELKKQNKDPETIIKECTTAAEIAGGRLDFSKSLDYYKIVVATQEEILGKNHPDTVSNYLNIANLYADLGNFHNADPSMLELKVIYYKKYINGILFKKTNVTQLEYEEISRIYEELKDYPSAILYLEKALAIGTQVLGAEHDGSLSTLYTKLEELRKYIQEDKAKKLCDSELKKKNKDPKVIIKECTTVAQIAKGFDNYAKSLEYYEIVVATQEETLGENHPDTISNYLLLARFFDKVNHSGQPQLFEFEINYYKKYINGMFFNKADVTESDYKKISLVYENLNDYTNAILYMKKAVEVSVKVKGRGNQGFLLNRLDKLESHVQENEARLLCDNELKKKHKDPKVIIKECTIAAQAVEQMKSLEYYKVVVATQEKTLGDNHPDTISNYLILAKIYDDLRIYEHDSDPSLPELEISYYQKYINGMLFNKKDVSYLVYEGLSRAYLSLNDYPNALLYMKKAVVLGEKELGGNAYQADVLSRLHDDLKNLKIFIQQDKAKKLCDNELKKKNKDPEIVIKECTIAAQAVEQMKSLEYYKVVLATQEETLGKNHRDTISNYLILTHIYDDLRTYEPNSDPSLLELEISYYKKYINGILFNQGTLTQTDYEKLPQKMQEYEAKRLCDNELKKKNKDPEIVIKECSRVSKIAWGKKALDYYKVVLKMQEATLGENHIDTVSSYLTLSELYQGLGLDGNSSMYELEINYYKKYINGILFNKKDVSYLDYERLSDAYLRLNDHPNAIRYMLKALAVGKKELEEGHDDLNYLYRSLSLLYAEVENYKKAVVYEKKYLLANERKYGKDDDSVTGSYSSLHTYYIKLGDIENAMFYSQELLRIDVKLYGEKDYRTARSYLRIGNEYKILGDYSQALSYFKKSLKLYEEIPFIPEHDAASYAPNGYHLSNEYFNLQAEQEQGMFASYVGISDSYIGEGNYLEALVYAKKASAIPSTFEENAIQLGLIYTELQDYVNARKYLNKALEGAKTKFGRYDFYTAECYNQIGTFHVKTGNDEKALDYFNEALKITTKILEKEHSNFSLIYKNLSFLHKRLKAYPKAYTYAKLSFDNFILNRDKNFHILDSKQKKLYLKSNSQQVPLLLEMAYFYANESMKEAEKTSLYQTTLSDWLNYKGSIYDSENAMISIYENTKDEELKDKIDSLMYSKRELASLYQTLPKTKEERSTYQQRIKDAIKSIKDKETEISSKASSLKEELGLRTIDYKNISENLKDNELYIDYAKTEDHYYIFTLDSKDNITFNQIDENESKVIDSNIKAFRKDIDIILNASKLTDEELAKLKVSSAKKLSILYDLTLPKVLEDKYSSLIISSDGALRLIPFETMFNSRTGKYLIQEKSIRYIPSGKELVRLFRQDSKKLKEKIVLFSDPDFDTKNVTLAKVDSLNTPSTKQSRAGIIKSLFKMRFAPLPGTKAEAKSIEETLKDKTDITGYQQEEANEVNLMKVQEPKILHIATHGFFINDNSIPNPMLKSGIALSGANASAIKGKSDGIVTALKLSGLKLKGTDLVVLSACQTGVVDPESTDSVSGLSKAFIQAGAKDIVMSLWSVDDQATKDLMSSFYQEMQEYPSYAKALKEAKLKMIEKGMHPFYWAPFILSGL